MVDMLDQRGVGTGSRQSTVDPSLTLTPARLRRRPRFAAVAVCILLWHRVQDPVLRILGFGACLDAAFRLPLRPLPSCPGRQGVWARCILLRAGPIRDSRDLGAEMASAVNVAAVCYMTRPRAAGLYSTISTAR
jgi:hypothetical protein